MDMAMMGLAGTVVGASAMGVAGVAKSMAETYFPTRAAGRDHRHQINVALQTQRYEAVKCWRAGLCSATCAYREWAAGPRDTDPPNVVGDEWYEALRPHLPLTGEASEFRSAHEVHLDNPTLMVLSLEIGRIEKEWNDEASSGRRRRGRNR